MDTDTYYLCSKITKCDVSAKEYVDWAINMLMKEIETPSLKILASFMEPLYKPELEEYFYKCLDEIGWKFPPFNESSIVCIKYLAKKIVEGSLEPIPTAHEIYTYVRDLGYPPDLIVWLEIDDYIDEKVYCGVNQISDIDLIKKIKEEASKLCCDD